MSANSDSGNTAALPLTVSLTRFSAPFPLLPLSHVRFFTYINGPVDKVSDYSLHSMPRHVGDVRNKLNRSTNLNFFIKAVAGAGRACLIGEGCGYIRLRVYGLAEAQDSYRRRSKCS